MKLIGLCGFSKTGKNTAANNMPNFLQFAFADSLKADLEPLLKQIGCDIKNPEHKEKARDLLVAWGKTARAFKPDFWIDRLMGYVSYHLKAGYSCVITDVRYLNECNAITGLGGQVVRIHRPGIGPANDEELKSFAVIEDWKPMQSVMNDGTPEDLGKKIMEVMLK